MTRKFWPYVWAGMALPWLWLMRVLLWAGVVLFTIPSILASPCAKVGLQLLSWDDHVEDAIKRACAA